MNKLIVGTLALTAALISPSMATAQVVCGATITGHAELTGDLMCATHPDPALTIDGGRLDMNGFTLECIPNGGIPNGIVLEGEKSTLLNGTVENCVDGVVLLGTGSHHVMKVTSTGNVNDGFQVEDDSNGNRLVQNYGVGNGSDGFNVDGNSNQVVNNVGSGNDDDGFEIDGDNNHVNNNEAKENGTGEADDQGFEVDGDNNRFSGNSVIGNDAQGMEFDSSADGNRVRGNHVEDNGEEGIRISEGSTDNVLTGNQAFNNGQNAGAEDLLDQNVDCDDNRWNGNSFGTADPGCIN